MPEYRNEIPQFDHINREVIDHYKSFYSEIPHMFWGPKNTFKNIQNFIFIFRNRKIAFINEIDIEIDKMQQIFDEFEQMNPEFLFIFIVKFLNEKYDSVVFCRIII